MNNKTCKNNECYVELKGDFTNHNSEYQRNEIHPFTYFVFGTFIFLFIMVIVLLITLFIKKLDK